MYYYNKKSQFNIFRNYIIYILKLKTKTLQCSQFLDMNIDDNSKLQSSTLAVKKTIRQNCNIV